MVENIKLDAFPKESGVYLFKVNDEVIYVGSSKNLYNRMTVHKTAIRQGGNHNGTSKQELYQFLQKNQFTVEFQLTDDYRQLEQQFVEQYHPKYNCLRAYTGLGSKKGRVAEYNKERYQKYRKEILEQKKQYNESHKQQIKQYKKEYNKQYYNQLCLYNDQTLTLDALRKRFRRKGIDHPIIEAKKYIIKKESKTPIEFYDVYP